MKKIAYLILITIFFNFNLSAEMIASRFKITESYKEFDIAYYMTSDMKQIKSKENEDIAVNQTFLIDKNNIQGELRYSLFTDIGGKKDGLELQYSTWVLMCLNNIAGYEVNVNDISKFNNEDVKKEFNGDFGCTAFLKNPKSDYAKDYDYMMVEFFYKEKQGLVMRTYLFNNLEFVKFSETGNNLASSPLVANYHTFKFIDKK